MIDDKVQWVHDDGYGENGMVDIVGGLFQIVEGFLVFILSLFDRKS